MLASTPETTFIFTVFQFVLAGMICLVSSYLAFRSPPRGSVRPLLFVVTAFFLYSGHFFFELLQGLKELRGFLLTGPSFLQPPLAESLETLALACLVLVYHPRWIPQARLRLAAPVLSALVAVACLSFLVNSQFLGGGWQVFRLLNLSFLLAAGALYLRERGSRGLFVASPLFLLLFAELTRLQSRLDANHANLESVLKLAGLVLFALVLDRKSRNLYVQVFVRLNLIFVLLANGLILTITETERKHYLSFAELNLQELSEFLRGHVLYFWTRGQAPEQILNNPEIARKIVAEFGRIPSMRRVRVLVGDRRLEMVIAPDGTIDDQITRPGHEPDLSGPAHRGERIETLVRLPVVAQQRHIGEIEIDESLVAINARIADQLLTVFLAFTVMAVASGVLIGLTVRDANRTIRRQYEELERTNQQLLHAAKLASVGQLADGIAHEINNPAGIILTRSEYLASVIKERGSPSSIQEDVEVIRRQARRIAEIVGSLLTFSRPSKLQMNRLDLNALLTECLALLSPKFYSRKVEVHCELDKSLPQVLGDADRLEQVFINILNNAIEAMPQGGQLAITTGANRRSHVYAQVTDNGMGIAEEDLSKIFDPFFTTKQPGRGTGLGLSVSYGIVRDHGGKIEATCAPGCGTTFQVTLPLEEVPDGRL